MATHVDGYDIVGFSEIWDLEAPVVGVTGPAMEE